MYGVNLNKIKEFHNPIDNTGDEMLHTRLEFDNKRKLKKFSLNLTTKIGEKQKEIVRYDCGHGYLHMHRFYRKPPTKEKIAKEVSMKTAKELTKEIRENWKTWKNALIENYGGMT